MNLYDSNIWNTDIEKVMAVIPELEQLENQSIMITGATGLICSAVTDIIAFYNESHKTNIQIYAMGRSEQKMKCRFSKFYNKDYFHYVFYDSSRADNQFNFNCDYIIHGAANSSPNKIVKEPVETMTGNFMGVKYLLDLAYEKNTKRILFISSSEVYGKSNRREPALEDDYGYINILEPRNSYSVGKQAAETLCISYVDEYDIDSVIVRPGHIYGPTASINDKHISSIWAYNAVNGQDIIMKSDGSQIRSYVYCLDCASAILKVLLCGKKGKAYNISNPDSVITIKKMAQLLCHIGNVELLEKTANNEEKKSFNPMDNSSIDSSDLISLGWKGCFDAKTGLEHTVRILKEVAC